MQLAERHIIKSTEHRFALIDRLAFQSKNLYNAANYVIRQNFLYGWEYLNYHKMAQLMKSHQAYKELPAKVSQQILMILDKNWKSFFAAVKAYKIDPAKFTGRPKLPKYKDKVKGRNILVYTIGAISSKQLKKGIIKLSGTDISIKTQVKPEQICQVRLVPKCDSYVIEVIYDEPESTLDENQKELVASIDLGLNNLVALTSNQPGFVPFKRGLYKTSCGRLINADVNGSYNILRKAIPNAFSDGIESCVVQPRRVNPLEVKAKGEGFNASHVM